MPAPLRRVGARGFGEHMGKMRLIAETTLGADLRESQLRVLDQFFGLQDSLMTDPVLRRHAGAALE
jgi:hypothetical protein